MELSAFHLYDLRYDPAILLLSNGENSKVASERLGHLTLDTYRYVLTDMQEELVVRNYLRMVPRAGLEPARPFGQRIFLPL